MITVYHLNFKQFERGVLITGVDVEREYYVPVAQVDTEHIGTAYGFTQHTNKSWMKEERVTVLFDIEHTEKPSAAPVGRSSMVGDLLAYPDGRLYMVMGSGYKQVNWGDKGIRAYLELGDELTDEFLYESEDE